MNKEMNENIKILDELNDLLAESNNENTYQFIYSQSPNGFLFELEEFALTGQSFVVFDSNEPLPKDIEELYEKGHFSFREVVFDTIKHNITMHKLTLEIVQDLLRFTKGDLK